MLDFEIQRCTRRCAKTDRELLPGETCYSVLVAERAEVVRYDYSAEAWEGPPDEAIGWWRSQIPDPAASNKVHWAPGDVMLHYFQQLDSAGGDADVRYVLALLLVRRRVFRLEDTETDDAGESCMVLYCPRNEMEYRVRVVDPSAERLAEIQQQLQKLLVGPASEAAPSSPPQPQEP